MQVSNFVPTVNEAAATYKGKYGLTVMEKCHGQSYNACDVMLGYL